MATQFSFGSFTHTVFLLLSVLFTVFIQLFNMCSILTQ